MIIDSESKLEVGDVRALDRTTIIMVTLASLTSFLTFIASVAYIVLIMHNKIETFEKTRYRPLASDADERILQEGSYHWIIDIYNIKTILVLYINREHYNIDFIKTSYQLWQHCYWFHNLSHSKYKCIPIDNLFLKVHYVLMISQKFTESVQKWLLGSSKSLAGCSTGEPWEWRHHLYPNHRLTRLRLTMLRTLSSRGEPEVDI